MKLKLFIEKSDSNSSKSKSKINFNNGSPLSVNPRLPKNYEFIEILGQGAFGQVIKARDTINNKIVAIKLQRFDGQSNIFEKEIINLKKLSNDCDNLVCIRDSGKFYNKYYIVMDFIQGQTLSKYLSNNKTKIEQIFKQLVSVLKKLHSKKFAHMDIKPDNIMVDKNGKVYIVDLGISCFDNNCVGGTKKFLPPDLSFSDISVRERQSADVWALVMSLASVLNLNNLSDKIYSDILNNKQPKKLPSNLKISEYLKNILGMLSVSKKRMAIFKKL